VWVAFLVNVYHSPMTILAREGENAKSEYFLLALAVFQFHLAKRGPNPIKWVVMP